MAHSFIPTSTFGRYMLRQICEGITPYLVVQLLNVPTSVSGDRTQWTWDANWKNYAIATAFSGTGGSLNLTSTGATPPSPIALYEPTTSLFTGAYYEGEYIADSRYLRIYNNSSTAITFTHAAFFIQQPSVASASSLINLNNSLFAVKAWNDTTQATTTLNAYSYLYTPLGTDQYTGLYATATESFENYVDIDEDLFIDFFGPYIYTAPYPVPYYPGFSINKSNSPFFVEAYKRTIGVNVGDPTTTFFAELLNVTGYEPDFDEGWSGWSTYRINRYSTASVAPTYTYEDKEKSYTYYWEEETTTFEITWSGTQIGFNQEPEFIITPPASSSYTFTHIAVFINEADSPPPPGTVYTYTDTDKFMGVIKLAAPVTMTTTSANRAYPFKFNFMYNPSVDLVELGS